MSGRRQRPSTGGRTLETFADTPQLNAWIFSKISEGIRGDVLEIGVLEQQLFDCFEHHDLLLPFGLLTWRRRRSPSSIEPLNRRRA